MVKPDITAKEVFGLLDEVGFVEKVFWTLPPGILLTVGATSGALADRFGYPGRHLGIAIEDATELRSVLAAAEARCIYFVGDVENSGNVPDLERLLTSATVPVVNVLDDLYPTWCAARDQTGRPKDQPATTVAIICPARSGSTYLSKLLASTGQFGNVTENLRHHTVALTRTGAIGLPEWWSRISEAGASKKFLYLLGSVISQQK